MAIKPTQPAAVPGVPTPVPSRTDRQNFAVRADSMMTWFPSGVDGINASVNFVNLIADYIAEQSSTSLAASNFKGEWSDLSGPLPMPASVLHNNRYWILLQSLTAVEAKQPGVAPEWAALDSYSTFAVDFLTSADAASGRAKLSSAITTTRLNWATQPGAPAQVAGLMGWKNFGNGHVICDASSGFSPDGTAISDTTATNPWVASYPTLMGWNGSNTYGVRVDSARVADISGSLNTGANYTILSRLSFSANGSGGYIQSNDATWGMVHRPSINGTTGSHLFTAANGTALASIDSTGKIGATTMQATSFIGTLTGSITGNAATANGASAATFPTAIGSSTSGFTVRLSGYADVSLFSDTSTWGLYSAAGGVILGYTRGTGIVTFNGNLVGNAATATSATTAGSATTAAFATNAGTVNTLTSAQVGAALPGVGIFSVGSHIFAQNATGSYVGYNTEVAGSTLRLADDAGHANSTVFGGTWRCVGNAEAFCATLWLRVA
jgi:hypothetical protein